jgi:hypothetical protein
VYARVHSDPLPEENSSNLNQQKHPVLADFISFSKTLLDEAYRKNLSGKDNLISRIETYRNDLDSMIVKKVSSDHLFEKAEQFKDLLYEYSVNLFIQDLKFDSLINHQPSRSLDSWIELLSPPQKPLISFSTGLSLQNRALYEGIDQNYGGGAYSLYVEAIHRTGLSIGATVAGLVEVQPLFDQLSLFLSYEMDWNNFMLSTSYSKSFFSESSPQLNSAITNELALLLFYSNPWLIPSVEFSTGFSRDKPAYFLTYQLSYAWHIGELYGADLILQPAISGHLSENESSRNIYVLFQNTFNWQQTRTLNDVFQIKYYELSLPLLISYDNFTIVPELTFTQPVNTYKIEYIELIREVNAQGRANWRVVKKIENPEEKLLVIFGIGFSFMF